MRNLEINVMAKKIGHKEKLVLERQKIYTYAEKNCKYREMVSPENRCNMTRGRDVVIVLVSCECVLLRFVLLRLAERGRPPWGP